MRWQRGVPLPPRLSQQNLRAVQLQIRYIGKLLPQGLKTWLKSFFFFKVCFSSPFRNISCPQWKAPQNINNHKKSLLTEAELGKKNQKTKNKNRKMCSIQVVATHVIRCYWLLQFSHKVVSDSPITRTARLLCPWNSPGKNSRAGRHFPPPGESPTHGLNPHLLHWQVDS